MSAQVVSFILIVTMSTGWSFLPHGTDGWFVPSGHGRKWPGKEVNSAVEDHDDQVPLDSSGTQTWQGHVALVGDIANGLSVLMDLSGNTAWALALQAVSVSLLMALRFQR